MNDKLAKAHMAVAHIYAQESYCERKKVGAVIVKNGTPIAIGYNGTPSGDENCCEDEHGNTHPKVIHAEDNALRKLTGLPTSAEGAVIYVTLAPCEICAGRIVDAKIDTVYYAQQYRTDDGILYLKKRGVKVIHLPL